MLFRSAAEEKRADAVRRQTESWLRRAAREIESGKKRGVPEDVLRKIFEGFDAGKLERYRAPIVPKGEIVDLRRIETTPPEISEKKAAKTLEKDERKLRKLQRKAFFDKRFAALGVFNGMDTAGKDSTINEVFKWVKRTGTFVKSWQEPTERERRHPPLWRERRAIEQLTKGLIGLFNRSHWENVVVRFISPEDFEGFGPEDIDALIAKTRAFELEMARQGIVVVKIFLHISPEVQRERFEARRSGPKHDQVKFQRSDIENRLKWEKAMEIWGRIIAETNMPWAPWFIVPGDVKWARDYIVGRLWVKRLKALELNYPSIDLALKKIRIPAVVW